MAQAMASVSFEDFQTELDAHLQGNGNDTGPIAVLRGGKLMGVFLKPEEFEDLSGKALRRFLQSRMKEGPSIPHKTVMAQVRKRIRRHQR